MDRKLSKFCRKKDHTKIQILAEPEIELRTLWLINCANHNTLLDIHIYCLPLFFVGALASLSAMLSCWGLMRLITSLCLQILSQANTLDFSRKIPMVLIRHSHSKPYLESTLEYFSVPHWFTNNASISRRRKKNQMLSVIWIRLDGYSKSKEYSQCKECSKSKQPLNKNLNMF